MRMCFNCVYNSKAFQNFPQVIRAYDISERIILSIQQRITEFTNKMGE